MARTFVKVSISLPAELVALVDRVTHTNGTTRSRYVAEAIREKAQDEQRDLMIEGYQAMAKENRELAKNHLEAGAEVFLRNAHTVEVSPSRRDLRRRLQSGPRQRAKRHSPGARGSK
jgi:metal-responsive CopG/Arc/MetJ family transcriptional regulator